MLEELLDRVLHARHALEHRHVVRLTRAEARSREEAQHELPEHPSREVLVPVRHRHVRIEDRVVAVRLEDQRCAAGLEDTRVLGDRALRRFHVMERVLRVHDVEGLVVERQRTSVRDRERQPRRLLPRLEALHVDGDDSSHALTQEPRDEPVAATAVEDGLVSPERKVELLDAPHAVALSSPRGHAGRMPAAAAAMQVEPRYGVSRMVFSRSKSLRNSRSAIFSGPCAGMRIIGPTLTSARTCNRVAAPARSGATAP